MPLQRYLQVAFVVVVGLAGCDLVFSYSAADRLKDASTSGDVKSDVHTLSDGKYADTTSLGDHGMAHRDLAHDSLRKDVTPIDASTAAGDSGTCAASCEVQTVMQCVLQCDFGEVHYEIAGMYLCERHDYASPCSNLAQGNTNDCSMCRHASVNCEP